MDRALRVGVVIFNTGDFHAAHDAWEERWLGLDTGATDERFLHGLIQYTAAIYHATNGNWKGTIGLAESATTYLEDLPNKYRGIDIEELVTVLTTLSRDPEWIERHTVPPIHLDGVPLTYTDLSIEEAISAARILACEYGFDVAIIEEAGRLGKQAYEAGDETSQFVTFLYDFLDPERDRSVVFQHVRTHVEREMQRERDVDGLFE